MSLIAPEGGGVLKSYIRYHEVETLYKAWPTKDSTISIPDIYDRCNYYVEIDDPEGDITIPLGKQ